MNTAAILAGGRATRLQGVLDDRPKCLAPLKGKPFIFHQLELLQAMGVSNVVLLLGHLHEHVQAAIADASPTGLSIAYSVEDSPLGTAGALAHAAHLLREDFYLLNGDTLVSIDSGMLAAAHRANNPLITISLCFVENANDYGAVETDSAGWVLGFREKDGVTGAGFVNAGVYCVRPSILQYIPSSGPLSLERELLPDLVRQGHTVFSVAAVSDFLDIGTPQRLRAAGVSHLIATGPPPSRDS